MTTMTQQEVDEKYPLWKCQERPYYSYRASTIGHGTTTEIVSTDGTIETVEFVAEKNAAQICRNLNRAPAEWAPKFNAIGALVN